jgi:ankyrin repeat protein
MHPGFRPWLYGHERLLKIALMGGDTDMVRLFIEYGVDPSFPGASSTRRPVIHEMVAQHNLEMLKLLLSGLRTVDLQDEGGNTPLHVAFQENCSLAIVDLLLSAGASEDCCNNDGLTPLDIGVEPGASRCIMVDDPFSDQNFSISPRTPCSGHGRGGIVSHGL